MVAEKKLLIVYICVWILCFCLFSFKFWWLVSLVCTAHTVVLDRCIMKEDKPALMLTMACVNTE
jgi:hypothetical protein